MDDVALSSSPPQRLPCVARAPLPIATGVVERETDNVQFFNFRWSRTARTWQKIKRAANVQHTRAILLFGAVLSTRVFSILLFLFSLLLLILVAVVVLCLKYFAPMTKINVCYVCSSTYILCTPKPTGQQWSGTKNHGDELQRRRKRKKDTALHVDDQLRFVCHSWVPYTVCFHSFCCSFNLFILGSSVFCWPLVGDIVAQ